MRFFRFPTRRVPLLVAAVLLAGTVLPSIHASVRIPAETEDRLRAIYERGEFSVRGFQADWLADGSGYTRLERAPGAGGPVLVHYEAASGKRTVLVSLDELRPPAASGPVIMEGYAFSPDGAVLLIRANARPRSDGIDQVSELWTFDRRSGLLRKVAEGVAGGPLQGRFSPDGRRIVFQRGDNLYSTDPSGARTIALTTDGSPDAVRNGRPTWSPGGERIAFVQEDVSGLPFRPMLEPVDPTYPRVREVRYARVGAPIAKLRVGVASAEGGDIRWMSIPEEERGFYLGQVSWAGSSDELLIEKLSRSRDVREFLLADVRTGGVRSIYVERNSAWAVASYGINSGLDWVRGGNAFVVLSEKDGWRRAYLYARGGDQLAVLTPAGIDVIDRGWIDEERGWLYYYASPANGTQRYLYRTGLDGRSVPERVTPADQSGFHRYDVSPDPRWAFHTRSSFEQPPVIELIRLPEHEIVRGIEDNAELRKSVAPLLAGNSEFLKLDIGGGVVMDAWMIRPRDFDPDRRYPLFVYVYGEPHAQTVLDQWSGNQLYHQTIADLGYVVVSIDNRGTPAPKGAAWRRAVFGSLGPLSTEEQAAGVQELGRTRPYVDLSRVGVWGWSGGGSNTLNALFRRPDVFHVGIAVVPKPQAHLYNAWFQEIYMRTVEENPEGYRTSSAINYAEGLKGNLLIIHGTGETNTHLQIVEGLVDRLIALGKPFEYMPYPHRNHGISEGQGTSIHMRMLMVRYLLRTLPPGPKG